MFSLIQQRKRKNEQNSAKGATKRCFDKGKNKTINGPDKTKATEGLALANVMLITS